MIRASLVAQMVKNPPEMVETRVWSWVEKIPWRRERLPTPVFWPGEYHGQKSLMCCSPWGCNESDTTEWLSRYTLVINLRKCFFLHLRWLCILLLLGRILCVHTHTHTHTHVYIEREREKERAYILSVVLFKSPNYWYSLCMFYPLLKVLKCSIIMSLFSLSSACLMYLIALILNEYTFVIAIVLWWIDLFIVI